MMMGRSRLQQAMKEHVSQVGGEDNNEDLYSLL